MRRVADALGGFSATLERKQKGCFGALGERIGRNPWVTILISFLCAVALCVGVVRLDTHPSG